MDLYDIKQERIAEARSTQRDCLYEEFMQSTSKEELLKEILDNCNKDDIVEWLIDLTADDSDFYSEYREEAFNEYCENRE